MNAHHRTRHFAIHRHSTYARHGFETLEQRRLLFANHPGFTPLADQPQGAHARQDPQACIDFEDLKVGTRFIVGDKFVADNMGFQATVVGEPFTFSNGQTTARGFAEVDTNQRAGHTGQDLAVNNILLSFDFGAAIPGLQLNFGEFGGNLNLEINGDFANFQNFLDVDGKVIGRTLVTVPSGGRGQDQGELLVSGAIRSFKIGGQELWIDHICLQAEEETDWGDAPDQNYRTLSANGGPSHVIVDGFHLGARIDAEPDGQPDPSALKDDTTGVDDEDGVRFLTPLIPGQPAKIEVTASDKGMLDAWIDFSGNLQFDPVDQIFNTQALAPGPNVLAFNVPAAAQPSLDTYARFRFSRAGNLPPIRPAPDGEVEDYRVHISPRTTVPVVVPLPLHWALDVVPVGAKDPVHWSFEGLGSVQFLPPVNPQTAETFSLFVPDKDGMLMPNSVPQGADWMIATEVVNLQLVSVNPEDPTDQMTLSLRGPNSPLPAGPSIGEVHVRNENGILVGDSFFDIFFEINFESSKMAIGNRAPVRAEMKFDRTGGPIGPIPANDILWLPTYFWREGLANELLDIRPPHALWDVLITIHGEPSRNFDWGDAPDPTYPTLAFHNGAVHQIRRGLHLGRRVDGELDGQPSIAAVRDDVNPAIALDDEDGVTFLTPLVPGLAANVEVVASAAGWLNAWVDFDRDGTWSAPEQIFTAQALVPGANVLAFVVPATATGDTAKPTYSRWRFSRTHMVLAPDGAAPAGTPQRIPDGEVEDHLVFIRPRDVRDLDFGDAPDPTYPTLLVHDGARHVIRTGFQLGARIDAESDGQPTATADGDDTIASDDEDGVRFLDALEPGKPVRIEVTSSQDGRLDAWIDYSRNGTWDAAEQIAMSTALIPGANIIAPVVPLWAVPDQEKPTYARFRLSKNGGWPPHGLVPEGEVEDYAVRIIERKPDGPAAPVVTVGQSTLDRLTGSVQFPMPTFIPVQDGGQEWIQMIVPGAESLVGPFGMPGIPVWRRLLAVPPGAQVSISVDGKAMDPIMVHLYPFQETGLDAEDPGPSPPPEFFADPPSFQLDQEVYATDAFFPKELASIRPLGQLRDLHVALLEIATAQYNPVTQELRRFENVDFQIDFRQGQRGFLPDTALSPFENSLPFYQTVLNAEIVDDFIIDTPVRIDFGEEFLILTHPDFREAADTLAEWKNDKGIMTRVFEVGTGTARDTKEEIRDLIEERFDTGIVRPSYVLFLGDTEFIPTWYRKTYYSGGDGGPAVDKNQEQNLNTWLSLGTAHFNDAGTEYVELVRLERDANLTDTGATVADAVRFVNTATNAEVIVDNLDAGFSIISGTWYESSATDEFNGSSLWTRDEGAAARFTPSLPGEGLYEVFARWSGRKTDGSIYDRDAKARYKIISASTGTDTPYVYVAGGFFNILPDLANGRMPVDTLDQAMAVVDKIIAYEKTPPGGIFDSSFYNNASIASQFQGYRDGDPTGRDNRAFVEESERGRNTLIAAGKTVERIYTKTEDAGESAQEPNRYYDGTLLPADLRIGSGFPWSGSTTSIRDAFANGRFLIMHRDHGWPGGWSNPSFTTTDVDNLTNGNLTPVVYSINCASGLFDNETSGSLTGTSTSGIYFAERLIRHGNGGAVGVIGDTRNSNTWSNTAFYRGLVDATWPNNDSGYGSATPIKRLGDIMNYAKEYTLSQIGTSATQTGTPEIGVDFAVDTLFLYHVFGDPTLEMWTANPHNILFPLDFTLRTVEPRKLQIAYDFNGAMITAFQETDKELIPLGRGTVEDGRVTLDLVADVQPDQPIQLVACKDGACEVLGKVEGDLNGDGVVDDKDIDLLCAAIRAQSQDPELDLNGDGRVDLGDQEHLITKILETTYGDANLDGIFNSTDLIQIFQAGQYEDTIAGNSSWATGDWNCDGEFDTSDLIVAFQAGGYVAAARDASSLAQAASAHTVDHALIDIDFIDLDSHPLRSVAGAREESRSETDYAPRKPGDQDPIDGPAVVHPALIELLAVDQHRLLGGARWRSQHSLRGLLAGRLAEGTEEHKDATPDGPVFPAPQHIEPHRPTRPPQHIVAL